MFHECERDRQSQRGRERQTRRDRERQTHTERQTYMRERETEKDVVSQLTNEDSSLCACESDVEGLLSLLAYCPTSTWPRGGLVCSLTVTLTVTFCRHFSGADPISLCLCLFLTASPSLFLSLCLSVSLSIQFISI